MHTKMIEENDTRARGEAKRTLEFKREEQKGDGVGRERARAPKRRSNESETKDGR